MPRPDLASRIAEVVEIESQLEHLTGEAARLLVPRRGRAARDALAGCLGPISVRVQRLQRLHQPLQSEVMLALRDSSRPALERRRLHAFRQQLAAVRERLRQWPAQRRLVERAIRPQRVALPPPKPDPDIGRAEFGLVDEVYRVMHAALQDGRRDDAAKVENAFADIVLPMSQFMALMHIAQRIALAQGRASPLRFLDVGCGSGSKLLAAATLFDRADGLELDRVYVEQAQNLLRHARHDRARVMQGDALSFDGYGDYDVIYFYEPIRNTELQVQLDRRIFATARKGTILVIPYPFFRMREENYDIAEIAPAIYMLGLTRPETERLRRLAERIGTAMLSPEPDSADARLGWLAPMTFACRRIGYALPGQL